MSAEYAEGGFTPDGPKKKVVGVVHAGEWVASQKLVKSPVARPLLEALEVAQKANVIGTLQLPAQQVISASPKVIGLKGYGDELRGTRNEMAAEAAVKGLEGYKVMSEKLAGVISRLEERLNEPFVTVNTVTGDKGIQKAQDDYEKLMRNKRPKTKKR